MISPSKLPVCVFYSYNLGEQSNLTDQIEHTFLLSTTWKAFSELRDFVEHPIFSLSKGHGSLYFTELL